MRSRVDRIVGAFLKQAEAVMLAGIRVYQVALAPLMPLACRFHPSCSVYATEAIRAHGGIRGARMAVSRVLRCHPFHRGGLDPVPPAAGNPD